MSHIISKEKCQANCVGLVCPGCGWELSPIDTVDNAGTPTFWVGCERCCKFSGGIKPETYDIAEVLVSEGYSPYSFETSHESKVDSASRIVSRVLHLNHKEQAR